MGEVIDFLEYKAKKMLKCAETAEGHILYKTEEGFRCRRCPLEIHHAKS